MVAGTRGSPQLPTRARQSWVVKTDAVPIETQASRPRSPAHENKSCTETNVPQAHLVQHRLHGPHQKLEHLRGHGLALHCSHLWGAQQRTNPCLTHVRKYNVRRPNHLRAATRPPMATYTLPPCTTLGTQHHRHWRAHILGATCDHASNYGAGTSTAARRTSCRARAKRHASTGSLSPLLSSGSCTCKCKCKNTAIRLLKHYQESRR